MGSVEKPPITLTALAAEITQLSDIVTKYVETQGNAPEYDNPKWQGYGSLPEDIEQARQRLKAAAKNLGELASTPAEHLRALSWQVSKTQAFNSSLSQCADATHDSTTTSPPSAGSSSSKSPKPSPCTAPSPSPP